MNFRTFCAATALSTIVFPVYAGLTLAADDAPTDPPWGQPATIAYVRNGDGTSNATVDAVLRYKVVNISSDTTLAKKSTYAFGVYVHRDNDKDAPRNDRGISASYGQFIVSDYDNSAGPRSLNWNAKLSLGKALEEYTDAAGAKLHADRTKDRLVVQLSGYYQPPLRGALPALNSTDKPPMIMFFDGNLGVYSDHSSGGSGKGVGRLSGVLAGASANFAPFGIDPTAAFNRVGGLGFVPTLRLAAQVERDASASGTRTKNTYKLYSVEVALAFSKVSGSGIVPTLTLARSIGADLLTGRADTAKTELTLGLAF